MLSGINQSFEPRLLSVKTLMSESGSKIERTDGRSEWLQTHAVLAALIILACALSVRLFFTLRADPAQLLFPDSGTYLDPAVSILESGSFINKYQKPEITRTPGYPLFLAGLMSVFGTELRTLLIAQAAVVSSSVLVLYLLARRILPPVMAFIGCMLAAFSPWGAVRAGFLLSDALFLLLLATLFLVMYLVLHARQIPWMVIGGGSLVGLLTSAVVFVRPVFPLIVLIALAMFLLYPDKRARAWLLVAAMVVCAVVPLHLWKMRNLQEAQFHGFSDVSGKAAWQWLASSVKGQVTESTGDRWTMLRAAEEAEYQWMLSPQEAHDERWRLANEVFRAHPFTTIYVFGLNAGEALIHPQPSILTPAGLNFRGDAIALGGIWIAFILCAAIGLQYVCTQTQAECIDRNWLVTMLVICSAVTLTAGVSFGAGARYRIALELIVPLLAGVGLVRMVTVIQEKRRLMWVDGHSLKVDHVR